MGALTMRVLVGHVVAVLLATVAGHSRGHDGGDLLRANEAPVMHLTPEAMANEIALDWDNKDKTLKGGDSQDSLVQSIPQLKAFRIRGVDPSLWKGYTDEEPLPDPEDDLNAANVYKKPSIAADTADLQASTIGYLADQKKAQLRCSTGKCPGVLPGVASKGQERNGHNDTDTVSNHSGSVLDSKGGALGSATLAPRLPPGLFNIRSNDDDYYLTEDPEGNPRKLVVGQDKKGQCSIFNVTLEQGQAGRTYYRIKALCDEMFWHGDCTHGDKIVSTRWFDGKLEKQTFYQIDWAEGDYRKDPTRTSWRIYQQQCQVHLQSDRQDGMDTSHLVVPDEELSAVDKTTWFSFEPAAPPSPAVLAAAAGTHTPDPIAKEMGMVAPGSTSTPSGPEVSPEQEYSAEKKLFGGGDSSGPSDENTPSSLAASGPANPLASGSPAASGPANSLVSGSPSASGPANSLVSGSPAASGPANPLVSGSPGLTNSGAGAGNTPGSAIQGSGNGSGGSSSSASKDKLGGRSNGSQGGRVPVGRDSSGSSRADSARGPSPPGSSGGSNSGVGGGGSSNSGAGIGGGGGVGRGSGSGDEGGGGGGGGGGSGGGGGGGSGGGSGDEGGSGVKSDNPLKGKSPITGLPLKGKGSKGSNPQMIWPPFRFPFGYVPKPCKCDKGYFKGAKSLMDVRVFGLWAADMALRLRHKLRVLLGVEDLVFCDQEESTSFCDCPLHCPKVKPGQRVINKLEQIELLKCCPYKFGMCCECTSKKKLKCMKKCLQEKVAIDAVDGSFVKSHVLFCGFACQACDRDYWPENEQAMCPVADDLWRKLKVGASPPDKKQMMPLWMLRVARHALNLQFWTDTGQNVDNSDDGRDCFSMAQKLDSKAEEMPDNSAKQKEAENEKKSLNSPEGKADLSAAKKLMGEFDALKASNPEEANAKLLEAVEMTEMARLGGKGPEKSDNESWLRKIMRVAKKGLQSVKDAVTGGGTSSSLFPGDEEEAFLEVESDRVERAINFLIGQETSVPHAELRTVLHGLARDNAVFKSAIMAHGVFVEKQHAALALAGRGRTRK